jgi:hypothetical protein
MAAGERIQSSPTSPLRTPPPRRPPRAARRPAPRARWRPASPPPRRPDTRSGGKSSVIPKPRRILTPVRRRHASASSHGQGAAPDKDSRRLEQAGRGQRGDFQHLLEHGGHGREHGDAVSREGVERLLGDEALLERHRGAREEGGEERAVEGRRSGRGGARPAPHRPGSIASRGPPTIRWRRQARRGRARRPWAGPCFRRCRG